MKKSYEELELKVIRFASEDVITASGDELCTKVMICIRLDCPELFTPCDGLCLNLNPCMDKCAVECIK